MSGMQQNTQRRGFTAMVNGGCYQHETFTLKDTQFPCFQFRKVVQEH